MRWWVTLVRTSAKPELARSFSRIHQLLRLETINLTFVPDNVNYVNVDCGSRLALQASILGALADSFSIRAQSKLTSLSLNNLRTWDLTPLESSPFQAVLKNLRCLRLSMLYEQSTDPATTSERWSHFWGTLFHRVFLSPTQHTLTELTLESDQSIGASSRVSFAELHFPYLCALSLGNIIFEPSVESFILRHASTPVRLKLSMCVLLPDTNLWLGARPIHWAHIWDNFAVGLTALVALRVDEGGDRSEGRYVHLDSIQGFYFRKRVPEPINVVDNAALQRFYETVSARSNQACNTS